MQKNIIIYTHKIHSKVALIYQLNSSRPHLMSFGLIKYRRRVACLVGLQVLFAQSSQSIYYALDIECTLDSQAEWNEKLLWNIHYRRTSTLERAWNVRIRIFRSYSKGWSWSFIYYMMVFCVPLLSCIFRVGLEMKVFCNV